MTNLPVSKSKTYFVVIRKNIAENFSNIKSSSFILIVYKISVSVCSVYSFLEIFFLKLNFTQLTNFRLFLINLFLATLKFLFFVFYYSYFYLMRQLKVFLIQNNFVSITTSIIETQKSFLLFSINLNLKFISFHYQLTNFYMKISHNNVFVAIIFALTTLTLIIRLYFLVLRFLRLKKIILFYLEKNEKKNLEEKLKASLSFKSVKHSSQILTDFSYVFFCSKIFISILLCFYKIHQKELLLLEGV